MILKRFPQYYGDRMMPWGEGTVVWGAGGFAFLGGVGGGGPEAYKWGEDYVLDEPIGQQAKESLEKIKTKLESYGTSLENIVHIWYYIVGEFPDGFVAHPRFQEAFQAIDEFWKENAPSLAHDKNPLPSTVIGCTGLGRNKQLIEILAFAVLPPLT